MDEDALAWADPFVRRLADVLRAGASASSAVIVDDAENILEALRSGARIEDIVVTEGAERLDPRLAHVSAAHGARIRRLSGPLAAKLFQGSKRPRVVALAERPPQRTLDDIARRDGDVLVLDGVRLAGNIGALTRTAAAFDAAGIVLVGSGLASAYDRRLIRASRGLVFAVPVVLATHDEVRALLSRTGATLVSLAATATTPVSALRRARGRVALLLGSERAGASPELESLAAERVAIPMHAHVESLNVSVAGALALYERRSRRSAGRDRVAIPVEEGRSRVSRAIRATERDVPATSR